MARSRHKTHTKAKSKTPRNLPVLRSDASGIDIGARMIHVAVAEGRDSEPVRTFPTFTEDLVALADWLQQVGITTVAMESTGVYWIPLYQILEERGIEVYLVNARHVKNVPGRKTDVSDCQWLQFLHSVGLLNHSFRPAQAICTIRTLLRHRESLTEMASSHVQHIQKALDQMNLQIHHVISDITGQTGLAILDAILNGQRDPEKLAEMRDRRIKASRETIIKSLVGDYRFEHLFTLKQALEIYRHYQKMIAECEKEIYDLLAGLDSLYEHPPTEELPEGKRRPGRPRGSHTQQARLQKELHRVFGVDLTAVPGLQVWTALVLLTEIGPDLSKFPNAGAFASWLGLCPSNKITGGKILSAKTRQPKSGSSLRRLAVETAGRASAF
jgi:transposase